MALMVGGTLCALALFAGFASSMVRDLVQDAIVMRALGVTLGFAGFMLARVSIKAAAGARRAVALMLATPLVLAALVLLARPSLATYLHDTDRGIFVPWVFGVPAILALLLSRWRVR